MICQGRRRWRGGAPIARFMSVIASPPLDRRVLQTMPSRRAHGWRRSSPRFHSPPTCPCSSRRGHDVAPAWRARRNKAPLRRPPAGCTSGRRRAASRACSSRAGRSATAQPPFCASSPILTWTKQSGRRPVFAIALAKRGDQRRPVERMDRIEQGDRFLRLVGLELADQMEPDVRDDAALQAPAISPAPPAPDSRRNRAGPRRSAARSLRPAGSWRRRSSVARRASGERRRLGDPGANLAQG